MTGSSLLDQLGSIMGPATYRYKVYLGFSHKCINEVDCTGIDFDSFLKGDPVEDQSKTEESATKAMEEWIKKSPLSSVIQWEIVSNLSENEAENFSLYVYPTIDDSGYGSMFGRRESVKYKDYKMSAPIPKCAKTVEPARWIEAYLALDTLTDMQRSMLESNLSGRYFRGGAYMPSDDFEFNMTTWVRKEYEAIGASNYVGERKFKIELNSYGEADNKEYRVDISSYVFGSGDDIAYTLKLPLCEAETE